MVVWGPAYLPVERFLKGGRCGVSSVEKKKELVEGEKNRTEKVFDRRNTSRKNEGGPLGLCHRGVNAAFNSEIRRTPTGGWRTGTQQ